MNEYPKRIRDFPERIFLFENFDADKDRLFRLISSYSETFVEVGSGSGGHLIEIGRQNPQAACFGFELRYKRSVRTIEKANVKNVKNVFVLHIRGEVLSRLFQEASVDKLYVNFPDPWEKRRWKKNRLLNSAYLNNIHLVLKDGGEFLFKSDHYEYFSTVLDLIKEDNRFLIQGATNDLYSSDLIEGNITTEFESMFISQNKPVNFLKIKKAG